MKMEQLNNVNFNQFEDEFGNIIKKFEVIKYYKNSNNEWTEEERFENGRRYYIVDGQLYYKCNNSLLPMNMDFDSEDCGACYQVVEEIKETKKITNNEILFTCKGMTTLSLHKQSYSDGTCFYSLQDNHGNFRLGYGSNNIQDIINQLAREIESSKRLQQEDNSMECTEIYQKSIEFRQNIINNLKSINDKVSADKQENKIKVTNNEYEKIMKELASRIYATDEAKITMKQYDEMLDDYEILPFEINIDNEELKKIINTYADSEDIEENRTIYRGLIDKGILYNLYANSDYNDLYIEYYQMIICKDELKTILTYCEGDFIAEVYNSIEDYNAGIERTKQFIKQM